jgi:hypothetical protein
VLTCVPHPAPEDDFVVGRFKTSYPSVMTHRRASVWEVMFPRAL